MEKHEIKSRGFTLIELLIVVAIIAILAGTVIMIINPGERILAAREAARESHMITIGQAIHLAVLDCGGDAECANAQAVVDACQTDKVGGDITLDADKEDCPLDDDLDPLDPLTDGEYFIEHDGVNNVEVWADSDESEWYCDWDGIDEECDGTSKRF